MRASFPSSYPLPRVRGGVRVGGGTRAQSRGRARHMAETYYWEALRRAHDEELANDANVIVIGEDVGVVGGTYKATQGLYQKYGENRVIDTPISENSFCGIGIGASMAGLRPVIEIMSINFALLALDTLINAAAKIRY